MYVLSYLHDCFKHLLFVRGALRYLTILLVALYGPNSHSGGDAKQRKYLMGYGLETAATYEDGADSIDKVVRRIDVSGQIGPVGHGACGSEETAEQHLAYHKEPHNQHGLLHCVAVVGKPCTFKPSCLIFFSLGRQFNFCIF